MCRYICTFGVQICSDERVLCKFVMYLRFLSRFCARRLEPASGLSGCETTSVGTFLRISNEMAICQKLLRTVIKWNGLPNMMNFFSKGTELYIIFWKFAQYWNIRGVDWLPLRHIFPCRLCYRWFQHEGMCEMLFQGEKLE